MPSAGGAVALRPLHALAFPIRLVQPANAGMLLDRLLRGRGWVVLTGVLLAGIVFFNVSLLELNSGITRTSERASTLKRENAGLRERVGELSSSERIQRLASERGMFLPAPGDVTYVRVNPSSDARQAVRRMQESEATALVPAAPTSTTPPAASDPATGAPAPTTTTTPPTAAPPAAQPQATTPAPTAQAPATTTDTAPGG